MKKGFIDNPGKLSQLTIWIEKAPSPLNTANPETLHIVSSASKKSVDGRRSFIGDRPADWKFHFLKNATMPQMFETSLQFKLR